MPRLQADVARHAGRDDGHQRGQLVADARPRTTRPRPACRRARRRRSSGSHRRATATGACGCRCRARRGTRRARTRRPCRARRLPRGHVKRNSSSRSAASSGVDGRDRDLELARRVLRVQLLDRDAGRLQGGREVARRSRGPPSATARCSRGPAWPARRRAAASSRPRRWPAPRDAEAASRSCASRSTWRGQIGQRLELLRELVDRAPTRSPAGTAARGPRSRRAPAARRPTASRTAAPRRSARRS